MAKTRRARRWRVRLEFKLEDCWVGVFWRTERTSRGLLTTWWVCILPMLPIVIQHATDMRWCYECGQSVNDVRRGEQHGRAGWVHVDCITDDWGQGHSPVNTTIKRRREAALHVERPHDSAPTEPADNASLGQL